MYLKYTKSYENEKNESHDIRNKNFIFEIQKKIKKLIKPNQIVGDNKQISV